MTDNKNAVEDVLQIPPVIMNPGAEYSSASRRWQGIPGIECASNGRLWATWYSGGDTEGTDNYVLAVSSEDDGQSWSQPLLAIDPVRRVRAFDPVLWVDPSGGLWLFWAQSEGLFDGRAGVWAIWQEDATQCTLPWSEPRRLCDGIMMNKPTVLSSGEWVLPVAIWEHKPPVHPAVPPEARTPHIVVSQDKGQTWTRRGGAEMQDRGCDEHMIVERQDNSLWMLTRLNEGIGESTSNDKGWTWSKGRKTELTQPNSRFYIRRLASGNLLLVKHHEFTGRSHLTAFVSDDDGRSWQGGLLLDERSGVSYPDGTQARDGRIYVTYDRERKDAKEILMAVFTEEDVLAQAAVSDGVRLKVLIDKVPDSF